MTVELVFYFPTHIALFSAKLAGKVFHVDYFLLNLKSLLTTYCLLLSFMLSTVFNDRR